jgi:hypothetical protein
MLLINKRFIEEKTIHPNAIKDQTQVLQDLLRKARQTELGKAYYFDKILSDSDLHGSFQEHVPIFNYESFYDLWLQRAFKGEQHIFWPERINYFALSSGTTSSSSKMLPVSKAMMYSFFKQSRKQLASLKNNGFASNFFTTSCLTLGGSTDLTKKGDIYFGDLSGILQKNTPLIYKPFKKPGRRISGIKDWNEKLDEIIKKAPKWNVGSIAGIPNWVIFVLEGVIKHYNLKTIHDIWPNFQLCLHGGIELGSYKDKIQSLCREPIIFLNTYLASEGYFAYQVDSTIPCMRLLMNNGIYYEFITKKDFKKVGDGDFSFKPLRLSEVEENVEYGLIITTNSGLWRYIIGDTIKFTSKSLNEITFQGRIQQTMNAMGEHLTLANLTSAVNFSASKLLADFSEFCIQYNATQNNHLWYIGSSKYIKEEAVATVLDQALQNINDDYRQLRKFTLNPPLVKLLPRQKFEEFMSAKGKLGGQNKFPRVMNPAQIKEWDLFLHA